MKTSFGWKNLLILVLLGVSAVSCSSKSERTSGNSARESDYCAQPRDVVDGVTVTGRALYRYFKARYAEGNVYGLAEVADPNPIRRAEVRVLDSSGNVVQCGHTDGEGGYSVKVTRPGAPAEYRIEINSRGDNDYIKASILDKVSTKQFYSIFQNFSLSPTTGATLALQDLIAPHRVTADATFKNLEGGAFHIFDKIMAVNDFLRAKTKESCAICQSFTVAPKVTVYWTRGFNPSSYFGESSGLSFFDVSGSIDSTPSLYCPVPRSLTSFGWGPSHII